MIRWLGAVLLLTSASAPAEAPAEAPAYGSPVVRDGEGATARGPDRRIVDRVVAGDAASEAAHGYVGTASLAGVDALGSYRASHGWMHYAMATFEDTEVTLALTFATDSLERSFDTLVEGSLVSTTVLEATAATELGSTSAIHVELLIPFHLTAGKSGVAVLIRARGNVPPKLREMRTVQDHNEV